MTSWKLAAVALVSFTTVAGAAPKKLKAHVECMSGMPVKAGKPAKLDSVLFCSIHVDSLGDRKLTSVMATLRLVPAKPSKLSTSGKSGPLADTQDGIVFELTDPWVSGQHYNQCESTSVIAVLDEADHPGTHVWTQTFAIVGSCPSPAKVAATLGCNYIAQDHTIIKWPGNGTKLKARLESTVACTIDAPKAAKDVVYEVSLAVVGKGKPSTGKFEHDEAGHAFFSASFEEDIYQACSNFTITGEVTAAGTSLWTGKLPIKQDCPD